MQLRNITEHVCIVVSMFRRADYLWLEIGVRKQ